MGEKKDNSRTKCEFLGIGDLKGTGLTIKETQVPTKVPLFMDHEKLFIAFVLSRSAYNHHKT